MRHIRIRCVIGAGTRLWPRCTLSYAPPELVRAACDSHTPDRHKQIVVAPSHDVYAVGMIAFEALSGRKAFGSAKEVACGEAFRASADVQACASGTLAYPWDAPAPASAQEQEPTWRKSRLWPMVAECLRPEPARRPSAESMCARLVELAH